MKLRYTPRALHELEDVLAYVAQRSPRGARRVQSRIQEITELLVRQPHGGRRTSLPGLRRIAAIPYPYLIFYTVTDVELIIVAVRHAMRDPAAMPDKELE